MRLASTIGTDVCIVGAGAAGLTLAHALRRSGLSVVVLESGPVDDPKGWNAGESVGHEYNGLLHGRIRGLGGTTAVWPGQCLRLRPRDLAAWPFELDSHYRRAEGLLGIPPGETAIKPRLNLDPTRVDVALSVFARRKRIGEVDIGDAQVLTKTFATRVESGRVEARDADGREVVVQSGAVVVAAGTLETIRLLLLSGVDAGRGFEDHASAAVARASGRVRDYYDTYGMHLRGGLRRYAKPIVGDCMVNVTFRYPGSPLDTLLRVRRERKVRAQDIGRVVIGAPELAAGAVRLLRRREPAPRSTVVGILAVAAQRRPEGAVTLSEELDPLGLPRIRVDWRIGEEERTAMAKAVAVFDEELRRTGAGKLEIEPWLDQPDQWLDHTFDSFHPAGGARIGEVVDEHCEVPGVPGVYVCSAAAFPRSGCVNPTLTIVALAFRLAERLTT
jgi:choline dehydrogenase-like flavoprotein